MCFHARQTNPFDISNGFVVMRDSSSCELMQPSPPNTTVPSLHRHYSGLTTTTDCSAPVPGIGTLLLTGPLLEVLPSHPDDRFSCSVSQPVTGSRRLCAGCRPVGKQVSPGLVPAFSQPQVSTSSELVSTPRQRFTCVRLHRNLPDVSHTPFPHTLLTTTLYRSHCKAVCYLLRASR